MVIIGVLFAFGLFSVLVIMLASYLMVKNGTSSAVRAIERFFGPGCTVSTDNHVVTVRQIAPVLELATACSEFSHGYRWKRDNRKILGIPLPFTSKEAECNHICLAKAGFNFKREYCSFEFRSAGGLSLGSLVSGRQYDVRVTLPGPVILSVETLDVCIVDTSNWLRIWAALTEADRNAIMSEMFPETRKHLERAGRPLLDEARNRLESGLRSIMPGCVRKIDFEWSENTKAFDFEISGTERMIGKQ